MALELGLALGYWDAGPTPGFVDLAVVAEELGFTSVFTAEAWGSDVFTPLSWIGSQTSSIRLGTGIAQLSARTPTATAMHALTLDHLSGGRVILGLGVSGPQVVEGWYGQPFAKPLSRTREYVSIIRQVMRREAPVKNHGEHYPLPYTGEGSWGMGKPLKPIVHPLRADLPIILGAEGPKNVALAVELCDGWIPLYYTPYRPEVYRDSLVGMEKGFEIFYGVPIVLEDDVDKALMSVRERVSFYVGGMGSKKRNFHRELFARMGYPKLAEEIMDAFMSGRRQEAAALVPTEFADEISLVGSPERIRDRLAAWDDSLVTTLLVGTRDPETLRRVADIVLGR